ncbi:hypothetical protein ACB098_05G116500 [Castanea mollissima]
MQLINHGVSISLVEKVNVGIQELFNLPREEKKKLWQLPRDIEGFGQAFVLSEEQKLDWGDMFYMLTRPIHLRKATLICLLKADSCSRNEMNYYPPCPQPELVMGLNAHSDAVALTILLQTNEMEGLQIRKDGRWIPVKPLPNAFIVNVGDILSIEHRATVNSAKERLSMATFYNPILEVDIGLAPSLITPESLALFKTISVTDFHRGILLHKLDGKAYIDGMRIQNEEQKGT